MEEVVNREPTKKSRLSIQEGALQRQELEQNCSCTGQYEKAFLSTKACKSILVVVKNKIMNLLNMSPLRQTHVNPSAISPNLSTIIATSISSSSNQIM